MPDKRKKQQKSRSIPSWIIDIPINVCVFFIISGIILGNLFVILPWYDGKLIDKHDAIPVSATFDSYTVYYSSKGHLNGAGIYFRDHDKLYIDGTCFNAEVEDALKNLESGEKLELLLHTNLNDIWEMKSNNSVILSFEDSKTSKRADNIAFTVLGAFAYFFACVGITSLLLKLRKRRKNISLNKNAFRGKYRV